MRIIEDEVKNTDGAIIVEGKKDRAALETLGFKNILEISGKSLEKIFQLAKDERSVYIMTDFDREGEEKSSQLITFLTKCGLTTNISLRKKFKHLFIKK